MDTRQKLFEIADRQGGFFTTRQALEAGFHESHFERKLRRGEWIRERRGIYRLTSYPTPDHPDLVLWALWSQNRGGVQQGVWSHDTALVLYDLSDVMPARLHMTVPPGFRRRTLIPGVLRLHYSALAEEDIDLRQGYSVTRPLRTLIDVIREGRLDDDCISQAIVQAWERGVIIDRDLHLLRHRDAEVFSRMMRAIPE